MPMITMVDECCTALSPHHCLPCEAPQLDLELDHNPFATNSEAHDGEQGGRATGDRASGSGHAHARHDLTGRSSDYWLVGLRRVSRPRRGRIMASRCDDTGTIDQSMGVCRHAAERLQRTRTSHVFFFSDCHAHCVLAPDLLTPVWCGSNSKKFVKVFEAAYTELQKFLKLEL